MWTKKLNLFLQVRTLMLVMGIATAGFLSSCATNPVTGRQQVVLMSEEQEIAMGREADPQIVAEYGLYPDSAIQRFIRTRGQQMATLSHRPNLNWTFRVLDSDVINAFATPGGFVYFTRGIMAHMNDEAQFAGVLGHEIGHVTARHSVSQQTRATLSQVGLIAAMIAKPELAQFAEQASQGLQLMMLSYSRDAERESDELGVEYSSKAGYDAREMAKFFQTLARKSASQSASTLPEFLSTHPDPGNRYTKVTQLAQQWQRQNPTKELIINRNGYLKTIENIVYGEDPRQGFRENGVFYHPELRFQFNTPSGWQYQNTPSRVAFAPSDGSAMLFLALGQGNNAQTAAQAFVQGANIQVSENQQVQVNGLPALALVGTQVQQNQQGQAVAGVQVLAYFIQHNNLVYQFVGVSAPQTFAQYANMFQSYIQSFRTLTDQSKINIKPERITLQSVSRSMSLQQALSSYNVPSNRMEEMAILNGMQLNETVAAGTMIKIPVRR